MTMMHQQHPVLVSTVTQIFDAAQSLSIKQCFVYLLVVEEVFNGNALIKSHVSIKMFHKPLSIQKLWRKDEKLIVRQQIIMRTTEFIDGS